MNRAISKDLIVGVFAFVSLIIMVILSLEVNGKGTIGKRAQTFYADFDSVSGLVERTPVEVAGINSGYIESIELLNDKAKITIKLKAHYILLEQLFFKKIFFNRKVRCLWCCRLIHCFV